MEDLKQPLVSIIVITYNSSKYVLETLESAKAQTYQNVELIVSDDCSLDNTVQICTDWIENNKDRFVRSELVTVEKNTGIASNMNRGLFVTKGEWVKLIAGDDILYENCIKRFYEEIIIHPNIEIIFSNISINGDLKSANQDLLDFFSLSSEEQYLKLLEGNILPAPAAFFKLSTLKQLNGFDERFPYFEDFPFYIKALKAGKKFYYVNDYLVFYRINYEGVSNNKRLNVFYQKSVRLFFSEIFLRELKLNRLYLYRLHYRFEYTLLYLTELGLIKYQKDYIWLLSFFSILNWKKRIDNIGKRLHLKRTY